MGNAAPALKQDKAEELGNQGPSLAPAPMLARMSKATGLTIDEAVEATLSFLMKARDAGLITPGAEAARRLLCDKGLPVESRAGAAWRIVSAEDEDGRLCADSQCQCVALLLQFHFEPRAAGIA